jgi:hypothetical protein
MSLKPGYLAALLAAAGTVASIAVASMAAADPVWPVGGGEPADATLEDLEDQGYTVQINWVTGYPTVPLFECWVDAIHNPDGPPTKQEQLAIVYVDIGCPSNNFD